VSLIENGWGLGVVIARRILCRRPVGEASFAKAYNPYEFGVKVSVTMPINRRTGGQIGVSFPASRRRRKRQGPPRRATPQAEVQRHPIGQTRPQTPRRRRTRHLSPQGRTQNGTKLPRPQSGDANNAVVGDVGNNFRFHRNWLRIVWLQVWIALQAIYMD